MAKRQNNNECAIICWAIASLTGVLSMILLYWMGDFSIIQAIFTGGLIGFVLGVVLSLFICRGQKAAADLAAPENKPAARYAAQAAERLSADTGAHTAGTAGVTTGSADAAPRTQAAAADTGSADQTAPVAASAHQTAPVAASSSQVSEGSKIKPSKSLPGQQELAARKGDWKYQNDTVAAPAAPIPGGVPAKPGAAAPAAEEATTDTESKPALMDSPRDGGADDLKLISGVGPKLEETLNDMGIWHFDQVAAWGKHEIAWVDARLKFKGRIERDDWMSQAKTLAEGGATEFSRKKKKT